MIIDQTYQPQLPTNLSDPLMEANGMLTVYTFSVQRDLKSLHSNISRNTNRRICPAFVRLAYYLWCGLFVVSPLKYWALQLLAQVMSLYNAQMMSLYNTQMMSLYNAQMMSLYNTSDVIIQHKWCHYTTQVMSLYNKWWCHYTTQMMSLYNTWLCLCDEYKFVYYN